MADSISERINPRSWSRFYTTSAHREKKARWNGDKPFMEMKKASRGGRQTRYCEACSFRAFAKTFLSKKNLGNWHVESRWLFSIAALSFIPRNIIHVRVFREIRRFVVSKQRFAFKHLVGCAHNSNAVRMHHGLLKQKSLRTSALFEATWYLRKLSTMFYLGLIQHVYSYVLGVSSYGRQKCEQIPTTPT